MLMLKNYLLTAWRNLRRNPFYSVINITGLAIGLAVGMLILLWVQDESSYDGFHQNAANIFKINSHLGSGASARVWGGCPGPLYHYSRESVPGVANAVRFQQRYNQFIVAYKDKKFLEKNSAFVDSTFFKVFSFDLLKGRRDKPFADDNSIILTATMAKKYFGDKDPIGATLTFDSTHNFTISGVMADFPANSSIQYDILFPMSLHAHQFGGNGDWHTIDTDLGNYAFDTYVQLDRAANPARVEDLLTQFYREQRKDPKSSSFTLQPLTSIHLVAADGNTGALKTVRIFLAIAILILVIAGINYVNLSTARSMIRSKEVGIRKIIGAGRSQLFIQFILESALIFGIAAILAFALIYTLLPLYNTLAGKHLLFDLHNGSVWLLIGATIIGTLAAASIYPALLLSAFRPMEVLKGKFSFGVSNTAFRKILVVTQFTFSVGLIAATLVIGKQLKFIREMDLGFDKQQVFLIPMRDEMHDHFDAIRNELSQTPGIYGIATAGSSLAAVGNGTTGDTWWEGKDPTKQLLIHATGIDQHFIPLLKIKLIAGANFTGSKADSAHVILNETAIRQAGIKDPIGKKFQLWGTTGTIIGVAKDFNYASLKEAVEPTIFYFEQPSWQLYIKTTGAQAPQAIAAAEKQWNKYIRNYPFQYSFLDADFAKMYVADQRTGILFQVFAVVAIIISCLGLFGLATYTAQIKTKEIGIRRVLGASVTQVTSLLAREFILLVGISLLIATPLAWWSMTQWLQNYTYRTDLNAWIFLATGGSVLFLALATVCIQAVRAALANPVKSLRPE
jgi:putative ABC transport system permease protein